jgi:hypothetical protein
MQAHVFAWRWFSGAAMHGRPMTDAGWFIKGNKALTVTGRAGRWHYLPRLVRAAVRTAGSVVTLTTLWGVREAPEVTAVTWAVIVTAAAGYGVWRGVRGVQEWKHYRSRIRPLAVALGPAVGHSPVIRPRKWVDVPRDYATRPDAEVIVTLPERFPGTRDARDLVTTLVTGKLSLQDAKPRFEMAGVPRAIFTMDVPPPDKVPMESVTATLKAATPTAPFLGLGRAAKPVFADLDNDSPHVVFSMGSGGGKSVATGGLTAQVLHNGGCAMILDIKRLSHSWARGLPNVRYCRSVEEIHDACLWLQGEIDRRNIKADEGADIDGNTDHVDVGPRIIVLAEEMNATVNRLRAYWRKIKAKGDPAESPAVEALGDALFMGRAVKVNMLAVAQMFTARTAGGPEARENMGTRVLSRYTMNNWRMLVPEIWPMPRSSRKPGRVQVCSGGVAKETQIMFGTAAEFRSWASSGTVTRFPVAGEVLERHDEKVPAARAVGLAEACESGLLPIGLEAVRKARQRDPEFPQPVRETDGEFLYDPADLRVWVSNRPRARIDA